MLLFISCKIKVVILEWLYSPRLRNSYYVLFFNGFLFQSTEVKRHGFLFGESRFERSVENSPMPSCQVTEGETLSGLFLLVFLIDWFIFVKKVPHISYSNNNPKEIFQYSSTVVHLKMYWCIKIYVCVWTFAVKHASQPRTPSLCSMSMCWRLHYKLNVCQHIEPFGGSCEKTPTDALVPNNDLDITNSSNTPQNERMKNCVVEDYFASATGFSGNSHDSFGKQTVWLTAG